jgi:hypothetical protein
MSLITTTRRIAGTLAAASLAIALTGNPTLAQDGSKHSTFPTPEAAVEALMNALESGNQDELTEILGPGSEDIIDSGDAQGDRADQREFLEMYRTAHSLQEESATERTLIVGDNDWPFAVPIVQEDGAWYLDGDAGAEEIIYRRIGANELGAIAVCRGVVGAQHEYASQGRDGDPAGIFAFKLISDDGLQNGLYWPVEEGEPESPAGPFVAAAAAEGYRRQAERTPYHGYHYRMLYQQGESAAGGARDYFKDGALTEGFAVVAWPADYGVSGVMSFMVNQDGTVYQKDLGDNTSEVVEDINSFDPGSWEAVPEQTDD